MKMRIKTIELSWFRGAGQSAILDTGGKSVVIYGANGSGKSSFADALEYIVSNGKINHLSHEYSGPKQRFGVRNTHTPDDQSSKILITFLSNQHLEGLISPQGCLNITSDPPEVKEQIQCYDLERFILRQDEVAKFIHSTKGQKYSVLLPLLGLDEFEQIAENIKNIRKQVEIQSELQSKKQERNSLEMRAIGFLADLSPETIINKINELSEKYLNVPEPDQTSQEIINNLQSAIDVEINDAEPAQQQHFLLSQINNSKLLEQLLTIESFEKQAEKDIGAFIDNQIAVLEASKLFIKSAEEMPDDIDCPACGREISKVDFEQHVQEELKSLTSLSSLRQELIQKRRAFISSISQLRNNVSSRYFANWLDEPVNQNLKQAISIVLGFDLGDGQYSWLPEIQTELLKYIPKIDNEISFAVKSAPPTTQDLIQDKGMIDACQMALDMNLLDGELEEINHIVGALNNAESEVRENIKEKTQETIEGVSSIIQKLWEKLHPNEPIESVQLYIPNDADKAIDISLKFFGVEQPSPRLSLSEGHRNSLGLCVFLALVILDSDFDRPIILDDVVSSLDREHRGMLAKILLEDISDRQILLLTHDREWYTELRARLPAKDWNLLVLKPWENPEFGIQWSQSKDTFDDARAFMDLDPRVAGNRVRAIMDSQTAIAAEKLKVRVVYARGDSNDHRTCIEFLERINSMADKALKIKIDDEYEPYDEALKIWEEAKKLLVSWGNRSSHTGSLIKNEAEELIQVCENALLQFRCNECKDPIWIADQSSRNRLQCSCGKVQWRY